MKRTSSGLLLSVISGLVLGGYFALPSLAVGAPSLVTKWVMNGTAPISQAWSQEELSKVKPVVGTKWYSFADFLEKSLAKLSLPQRAAVDLIIVRSRSGESAYVPRTFVTQNSLVLSFDEKAPLQASPWGTALNSKVSGSKNEKLPIDKFTRHDVIEVEFTSYQTIYGELFLKKRSDPKTIRGERLLVQNCLGCHSTMPRKNEWAPSQMLTTLMKGITAHPTVPGFVRLGPDDEKALRSYHSARSLELGSTASAQP